jgi:hypothetical protein
MIVAILSVAWVAAAQAEQPKTLETTMGDIAADLTTLQREVEIGSPKYAAYALPSLRRIKLTGKNVPIYKGADQTSGVLMKLSEGKVLPVLDKAGEWYAVGLDQTNTEFKSGWVHASAVVPESYTFQAQQVQSTSDAMYQRVMDRVRGLKEKYQNNPYVRVTGFSVDITVPPAVSIAFEFK